MQTRSIGVVAILLALVAAGCAASGPAFQKIGVPDGKSVIYAYRPNSIFGGALKPTVRCGSNGISLARGGYHPFIVDPGSITCSARTEAKSEVRVDARPNEATYVKETIGLGFFVGHPHLQVIAPTEGEHEAAECALQEVD